MLRRTGRGRVGGRRRGVVFPFGAFRPVSENGLDAKTGPLVMARPRKNPAELRKRWSVLNVTDAERSVIEAHARDAGLSTCGYIVRRALQRPAAPRQDWQRIVRTQARLLHRLDEIAAALVEAEPVRDAGAALLALRRIEAQIAPWACGSASPEDGDEPEC